MEVSDPFSVLRTGGGDPPVLINTIVLFLLLLHYTHTRTPELQLFDVSASCSFNNPSCYSDTSNTVTLSRGVVSRVQ